MATCSFCSLLQGALNLLTENSFLRYFGFHVKVEEAKFRSMYKVKVSAKINGLNLEVNFISSILYVTEEVSRAR